MNNILCSVAEWKSVRASGSFAFHHVRVKFRWSANGLARVVDDEIEPWQTLQQLSAQVLDAGRVAHVETEDFQAMSPLAEIRLLRVTARRIARKASGHDEPRTGAQKFETGLIADLHASTGEQRDAAIQVGQFGPFVEIELRAWWTHLIVKMVDGREFLFLNVAMLRIYLRWFTLIEIRRWKDVRRREHGFPSKGPNSGFIEDGICPGRSRGYLFAPGGAHPSPARDGVGMVDVCDGTVKTLTVLGRRLA